MAETPDHLLIDLREAAAPAAIWSRPLLGLPVALRAVKAARRAGIGNVSILADPGTVMPAGLTDVDLIDAAGLANGLPAAAIYMRGDVLAETGWLTHAGAQGISSGTVLGFGPGVALTSAGIRLETVVAAAADAQGERTMVLADDVWLASERRLMASLVKSTDGFMARVFARPISLWMSRRLAKTAITPNGMTIISLLIGLAAAPFFLTGTPWLQAIGGLLFVAHSVIDGCDGELARLKFIESRLGGLLDFWSDNIVHVAVFSCMGIGWSLAQDALWPLLIAAPAVVGTGGSAITVYWLTMRGKTAAGPVYTSVSSGPASRLTRLLDELSRRDFIYLVFALSLFGEAAWFLVPTAIGAPVFLALVLLAARRAGRA
jgi:phosphatidylglycerophosphate synthase